MLEMQQNLKNLNIKDKDGARDILKSKKDPADGQNYDKEAIEELKPLEPYKDEKIETKRWTWPVEGKLCTYYQYWMLCHCVYYQLFVVSRISFEKKPQLFVIYLECYMDIVYCVDMFRYFTEPFMKDGRLVSNRRMITTNYLKGWFLLDVYAFFPLAYLRYISDYDLGGRDNV